MARRLTDVARKVGVSEATVSRVLNDKPGVSEATRASILTALDVMGYERPSQLRDVEARLVGLVLPELQNPIFPAFAEVVSGLLAQRGFTPVLCTRIVGGLSEADYVDMLLRQHVAGMVFASGLAAMGKGSSDRYKRLIERQLPTVLLNAAAADPRFNQVSCDDSVAVEQAVTHLVAMGHERIGLVLGQPDHAPSQRKLAAFEALARAGTLALPRALVARAAFSLEGGRAAAARLIEQRATALVCASDVLALGAIRAARRAGLRVPDDVSVVGYDDSPLMSCADPALTTVRQPIEAMARAAVDLLVTQIDRGSTTGEELLFEPELVVRASTAPPPPAR